MRNITTRFPNGIDDRIFWEDIGNSQLQTLKDYQLLLSAKNYTQAFEVLNNSDVFFYGAWLLNMFEERLSAIGKYLIEEEPNHTLVTYNDLEPSQLTDTYDGMNWISEGNLTEFGATNP